jgi:hypothetical protein
MKVSWDYDIANIWKNKIHIPNHQPECLLSSAFAKALNVYSTIIDH